MASMTGKATHVMATRMAPVGKRYSRLQASVFRKTSGRLWKRFLGKPVILMDVVGRASGQPRPVMLMRVERGDQFVVCGSNGGNPDVPNWYRNLVAAEEAYVEADGNRHHYTFVEVPEGEEREECWGLLVAAYPNFTSYQELTDRRLPVGLLSPT
ncbi:MAG: nitroreductase family deazaflavin-dependent oxidoreductase [Actinomycetia bacterium]|nr:nitroreductase family deazaflavin-dependent oxidoreductase [Actinomycetes bacterium]